METVQSFDEAEMDLSARETGTMSDPRSEGRGLVTGLLLAAVFWTGVAALGWWILR